jgi:hypothetical protein
VPAVFAICRKTTLRGSEIGVGFGLTFGIEWRVFQSAVRRFRVECILKLVQRGV